MRLSRLELALTRLRYCAITLALDPPVIIVTPASQAALIFSLTIRPASARAGEPPAESLARRNAMTRFDSRAKGSDVKPRNFMRLHSATHCVSNGCVEASKLYWS